ncbi:PAS/PAC sensor signal transduction histidine kinase [Candidatus Vecturithrix granuli]|uniref:histidine kinase n=1 Tax=Vecturithrix granuli TaxID=1499967 RepID=A0A081BXZ4_VECG1|nr:PAS/PAC sensor signal transduction histidine kinase [Candidatus Vecturithrix granuli]
MKRIRKLGWQIYLAFLAMIGATLVGVMLYASHSFQEFYLQQTRTTLEHHARQFRYLVKDQTMDPETWSAVDELCKKLGAEIDIRFTLILPSGQVIGDSQEEPARMDNHAQRPEVQRAFSGKPGDSVRYSYTLEQDMMYVAMPLEQQKRVIGVVRAAMPVTVFNETLSHLYREITAAGAMIAVLAAIISLYISRYITKPLQQIQQGATRYARGELHHRIHFTGSEELSGLADAMNLMASQLAERMQTVTRQRNELEAVLANMVEAVITVDKDERILRCNTAAKNLFGITLEDCSLRSIQEMIRNAGIQRFVKKTFESAGPVEDVLTLNFEHEQFLHVHGSLLPAETDQPPEALFVFHDITRLKQLENLRKEFVANVSHELRTPITSIVGFVETLLDGAIEDPENARKFLNIIEKNAQRLNSIITDLLTLSKIEQEKEEEQIVLKNCRIKDVLEAAILICDSRANEQQIQIDLECPAGLWGKVNAPLLEQAVVNLLDNAIKYSNSGATIKISANKQGQELVMAVQDFGCGIPSEHLPRLFERFYRVDKARSRTLGGTGLGLAIVKHITNVHRGRVTVESTPGAGSTFAIILPGA